MLIRWSRGLAVFVVGFAVFASLPLRGGEMPAVLSVRDQVETVNRITRLRLETLLPKVMREAGFDMWVILTQENNVDAVFRTMRPVNTWNRRQLMLAFYDAGPEKGIERFNISRMDMGDYLPQVWDYGAGKETRWEYLARIIRERDPKRIGINESEVIWAADGLSASLKKRLAAALDEKYVARLASAEKMCTLWLETLLDEDLELYEKAVSVGHALIAETYSNRVITPGVTTVDDLIYTYWQKAAELGLPIGFDPSFSIKGRDPAVAARYGMKDRVIRRGDLIHCDVGVIYLRYFTDHQEWAYVLRPGEEDVPETFKEIMAHGNRLQDVFCGEFRTGLSGNQMLNNILKKALELGIRKPKIYSHSVGYCLHQPGPLIGLPEEQINTGGRGEVTLVPNSTFTAELSITYPVPEWGGKELRMGLEQIVVFTGKDVRYLDGRQTGFHIIR